MSRMVMDGEFRTWEVFVNTGEYGFSTPPRIVFRCVSDRDVVSCVVPFDGEPNEALALVASGAAAELLALLETGAPLS